MSLFDSKEKNKGINCTTFLIFENSFDQVLNELIDHLNGLNNKYKHAFAKRSLIKIAVNKSYSPFETKINNNDEVAFFPPVTGG